MVVVGVVVVVVVAVGVVVVVVVGVAVVVAVAVGVGVVVVVVVAHAVVVVVAVAVVLWRCVMRWYLLLLLLPACAPHTDLVCAVRDDTGTVAACTDYLAGISDTDVIVACRDSDVTHGPCAEGYFATCEVNQDGRSSAIRYYAPFTLDGAAGLCALARGTLVVR